MSPRLILILSIVAVVSAAGASAITWIIVQPQAMSVAGSDTRPMNSSSDEEKRRYREGFFGNSDLNIHGGQEMKPRW
ncbi:entry exclusion protein TrbK [Rhizobium rhizogenes]|uniref:entry exclusion protein TrbK n=1 Tax=Rhizobium rhizogenes TaxID=359 RepID=UPI0015726A92|nr:entry exclusion protein TrbK [Rhizobium rhizogenes]NTH22908.1 entry exclusion protein TrbK [Rhizobium rhizogenes]NTH35937.1 entry exclusion protein TrbK [Rhizobium rhizogenes]